VIDNLLCFIDPGIGRDKFVENMGNYTDVHGLRFQVHSVNIFNIAVLLSGLTEVVAFLTCMLEVPHSNLGQDGELASLMLM
jgi:hypothetical protein